MASSHSILLVFVFMNMMMAFLMSTTFVIPGITNPFDDFKGIGVAQTSGSQPGSGTLNQVDQAQIQQAKAISTACGSGVIGGAVTGGVIGTIIPGLGTLVGAGVGALVGGIIGCVVAPTYPDATTGFINSVGGAVPALSGIGDSLALFGTIMQYITAMIKFIVDMSLLGILIWQFDPTIALITSPIATIANFWLGYVLIQIVRGRGG